MSKKFAAALTSEVAEYLRKSPDPEALASWVSDRLGGRPDAMEAADIRTVVDAYEEGRRG